MKQAADPMVNSVVGNVFTPIAINPKSHVRGWAEHWASMLGCTRVVGKNPDLSGVDVYYFDHGVNSEPGRLNLFGGVNDTLGKLLLSLAESEAAIVSLDHHAHADAYCSALRQRLKSAEERNGKRAASQQAFSCLVTEEVVDALYEKLSGVPSTFLRQEDFLRQCDGECVIGDSHATAFARVPCPVLRNNGLTLWGALRDGFFMKQARRLKDKGLERVTLVAGSVDVRHHLMRRQNPASSVRELAHGFLDEAVRIERDLGVEVELATPVPVEHEGRRIPKTGWHKGLPFSGSAEERRRLTRDFTRALALGWKKIASPPEEWHEMDPEEYAKAHMELATSVHIAPPSYRRHGGW